MLRKNVVIIGVVVLITLSMTLLFRKVSTDLPIPRFIQKHRPEVPQEVTSYLNTLAFWLDSVQNVGAAVTIVKDDEVLVTKTFGVKQAGGTDSIDTHTIFRLASVSKGFAGVLACLLEKDSIFSLNDKICAFMPEFRLKDAANTQNVTLLHTLSHTSGLVPHTYDNLIEEGTPLPLILQQLSEADLSSRPGVEYAYQNVMYSMIDTIVRIRTGKSYADMLEQRLFRPLKMRDASATPEVFQDAHNNIAYPHTREKEGFTVLPPNLGYYNIAPAAGVNISISDLSKWLLALLGNQPECVDSSILSRISTPVIKTTLQRRYTRRWGKVDATYYSLGWRIYDYKGRRIIYHGGYVRGYRAEIAFCPEAGIGIAFVQNSPNWVASMAVPTFLNYYFEKADSAKTHTPSNLLFEGMEWYEDSFMNVYKD